MLLILKNAEKRVFSLFRIYYLLAKISAYTAENELHAGELLPGCGARGVRRGEAPLRTLAEGAARGRALEGTLRSQQRARRTRPRTFGTYHKWDILEIPFVRPLGGLFSSVLTPVLASRV